jgi:hypothetical protein
MVLWEESYKVHKVERDEKIYKSKYWRI